MRQLLRSLILGSVAACSPLASAEPVVLHPLHIIKCAADSDNRPAVVTGVAVTPDGKTVAAATDNHEVTVYDTSTGALVSRLGKHGDWVRSACVSPDATLFATGANDRTLSVWDIHSGQRLLELPACEGAVNAVAFHPNGQQVAVVGFTSRLQIVNTSSGRITQQLDCACSDPCTVAFSADGTRMAAAGRTGHVRVWNVTTGTHERDITAVGRRIRAIAFSPDGKRIAAAGNSATINIFDVASGQPVMTLDVRPAKEFSLLFLDNRRLASGGTDNLVRIWDLDSRVVTAELVGHTGTVAALARDATGNIVVSGSYDTTLRVWNLAEPSAPATARREASAAGR
jgi:WD40 repeat protein